MLYKRISKGAVLAVAVMFISLAGCIGLKPITFTDIEGHIEPTIVVKKEYSYQEMLKVIKGAESSLWICGIKYQDNLSDEVNPYTIYLQKLISLYIFTSLPFIF